LNAHPDSDRIADVPGCRLCADCVAKVGGTSSDRPKRAILESEGANFGIKIPYSALIWKKFSTLRGSKSFCNTIGHNRTPALQKTDEFQRGIQRISTGVYPCYW
jgi:hypothetical protein